MDHGNLVPLRILHHADRVLGHHTVLRSRRTAADQWRRREVNRTLKEQIIRGRIYQNLDELHVAVREFIDATMRNGWSEEHLPEPQLYPSCLGRRRVTQGCSLLAARRRERATH